MICKNLKDCIEQEAQGKEKRGCVHERNVCIKSADRRPQVKCEEHRKKYILKNTKKNLVLHYKMDGGIIILDKNVPAEQKKCDDLYIICEKENHKSAVLAELKGVNVGKALEQLHSTLKLFPEVFKECEHVYARAVVTSSMPNFRTRPEYVKLMKLLKSSYRGNLKIAEKQFCEEDIELYKESRR